jgi:hypothetical protein
VTGDTVSFGRAEFIRVLEKPMAQVPQVYINCAVYLYPNDIEANSGKASGGTAVVVQVPLGIENYFQQYVVTAAHIVKDDTIGEGPVIRINADEGGFQLIPTDHDSWFVEEKDDLAIIPMEFESKGLNVGVIPTEALLTKAIVEEHRIGPGAEVFVTGRFIHHEGKTKNTPSVRFGSISMMPDEPFKRPGPNEDLEEAFLVEFRSVGGYSGSPVFLCEPPFHLWDKARLLHQWSQSPRLLGIDLGHIHDYRRVLKKTPKGKYEEDSVEKYYESNTAMSVIVPAWKLMDFLNREDIVRLRAKDEERTRAQQSAQNRPQGTKGVCES